jgi:hypothetical protein
MANRSTKNAIGVRLTDEGLRLLRLLSGKTGVSQAGILEMAIRDKAKSEGLDVKLPEELAAVN